MHLQKIMHQDEKHIDAWENCLRIIQQIIEPRQFDTWFKRIRPVSLSEATLTVEVPSDFFREYLEDAFLDVIRKTLRRVLGADAKLIYRVRPVQNKESMDLPEGPGKVPQNRPITVSTYQPSGNPGPFVYPGIQKVQVDSRLNPAYNLRYLVTGECNKVAVTAGENIAAAPGGNPFNPLFVFGGPGLGKTHLAQAIGLSIKEKHPELVVLYVTGNELKTQYMAAYNGNRIADFLAFYTKIDVLIVDDIQDMQARGTQNAFFSIFNHLHQSGKQLILTSDRPQVELQNFEDRLLSRFKWGLSVQMNHPDYATRLAMLKDRAFREGARIPEEVLVFLAERIKTNFRELEGALVSVLAHATLNHQECTVELASSIIDKLVSDGAETMTIDKVQIAVCDYFNITRDDLLAKSRKRQIVQARQIAMYLSRNFIPNCSLATIGSETGGKDHATVLHACTTVSNLMSTDRVFKRYVTDLENMLANANR